MNKSKAIKNIITATFFRVVILILSLISRRYLINQVGSEATGLFSLFTSILGFLAIAEIGIGSAISFSMYKPMIDSDIDKVSALYKLYKKIYLYIFIVITVIGLVITPLIPLLAKENTGTYNVYLTYIIFLFATVISYLYAHQTAFINAKTDNYVTIIILSLGKIIENILQIILLIFTKSFTLFLVVILISNVFQWIVTNIVFKIKYKNYINNNIILEDEDKKEIIKNTKAMFLHKIGGILVNTTDSLVISFFIGVITLGVYSNYITLISGLVGILSLVFTSIISIIGHSFAKNNKEVLREQFRLTYFINYLLGFVFFMGFFLIIDQSISFLFNSIHILDRKIVFIITLNYFIQFMRQATLSFRDASGTFYRDRYKPLVEGLLNLTLSILFVKKFGISGVLLATIITNLLITHTIEPYVLYHYGLESSPKKYYIYNYLGISIFIVGMISTYVIPLDLTTSSLFNIIINGLFSLIVSFIYILILTLISKEFRGLLVKIKEQVTESIRNYIFKNKK